MIGFLLTFIVYQLYRIVLEPIFALSALTIFDAAIVWLTWREWRKQTTDLPSVLLSDDDARRGALTP